MDVQIQLTEINHIVPGSTLVLDNRERRGLETGTTLVLDNRRSRGLDNYRSEEGGRRKMVDTEQAFEKGESTNTT